jgi:cytochrome c553
MNMTLRSGASVALAACSLVLAACDMPRAEIDLGSVTGRDAPVPPASTVAELVHRGDPARGIPPCTACHGQSGEGSMTAGFPRLAAQPAYYLTHQLDAFASGSRRDPAMTPIAEKLDGRERRALGAWFAAENAPTLAAPLPMPASRGEALALRGDAERGIPACSACHGWNGAGNAPRVPYLAGQNALYLRQTMEDWATGERDSDPRRQMPAIARAMAEGDAEAVAQYFSRLVPPGPVNGPGAAGNDADPYTLR